MTGPLLSVVIVTRNHRRDIGGCLESLFGSSLVPDEVIVVDHASEDGTPDFVRRTYPEVTVLDFWDNAGFAEGCNRGSRVADGEFLLLLNPDAQVEVDCLSLLVEHLRKRPASGAAAAKLVLMKEPRILNSAGLLVNRIGYACDRGFLEWDDGQFDTPEQILAGCGAALLFRSSVFRRIGGFDPLYFLYYEDLDLCWRSWVAGAPVEWVPRARVRHDMRVVGRPSFFNEYMDHRNRLRTLIKNLAGRSLLRLLPRLVWFEFAGAARLLSTKQWKALSMRSKAWVWTVAHLPSAIRARRLSNGAGRIGEERLSTLTSSHTGAPILRAVLPDYVPVFAEELESAGLGPSLAMGSEEEGRLGLGWHTLEEGSDGPYRWSCRYGTLFLRPPRAPWDGRLELSCMAIAPASMEILVNGEAAAHLEVPTTSFETLTLPVSTQAEVVQVDLLVSPTFVPSGDGGSSDHRTLGVAVSRAGLIP